MVVYSRQHWYWIHLPGRSVGNGILGSSCSHGEPDAYFYDHEFLYYAGLGGIVDTYYVSVAFTLYVVIDFVWVIVQPEAVPALAKFILLHHVVTIVLLGFPLMYPELGVYTCWVRCSSLL